MIFHIILLFNIIFIILTMALKLETRDCNWIVSNRTFLSRDLLRKVAVFKMRALLQIPLSFHMFLYD